MADALELCESHNEAMKIDYKTVAVAPPDRNTKYANHSVLKKVRIQKQNDILVRSLDNKLDEGQEINVLNNAIRSHV